jgi:hypothetical protein
MAIARRVWKRGCIWEVGWQVFTTEASPRGDALQFPLIANSQLATQTCGNHVKDMRTVTAAVRGSVLWRKRLYRPIDDFGVLSARSSIRSTARWLRPHYKDRSCRVPDVLHRP